MVLRDKMVHLVIVGIKGLLFPPKRGGTGTRDMLIRSQILIFCRFAICPQLRLSTDEPLACKDGGKIMSVLEILNLHFNMKCKITVH